MRWYYSSPGFIVYTLNRLSSVTVLAEYSTFKFFLSRSFPFSRVAHSSVFSVCVQSTLRAVFIFLSLRFQVILSFVEDPPSSLSEQEVICFSPREGRSLVVGVVLPSAPAPMSPPYVPVSSAAPPASSRWFGDGAYLRRPSPLVPQFRAVLANPPPIRGASDARYLTGVGCGPLSPPAACLPTGSRPLWPVDAFFAP